MAQAQSTAARRLLAIQPAPQRSRDDGHVRGPGTSTSDSIDAKLSDGEFVLPADTVRRVGAKKLHDLVAATHEPSGNPPRRGHFADGGVVEDERRQPISPSNIFPQGSPSAGAPVYAGAGVSADQFGSSGQFAQVPASIGQQPGRQPTPAPQAQQVLPGVFRSGNSFGDAAAAASNPGVTQVGGAAPVPAASPPPAPAATVANIPQPAQQLAPAGGNSFGDASAAARDPSVAQVPTSPQDARTRLLGPSAIPTDGPKAPAPDGSQDRWANSELGRNVTNSLAALPGVAGALPAVVKTGGAISSGVSAASRLLNAGTGVAFAGPAPASAAASSSPFSPSAEAGAGRGTINPPAVDPTAAKPVAPERSPVGDTVQFGPATSSNVTRVGNSYSGTNIAGDITINGQARRNGGQISDQNMRAADNLAASQEQGARGRLMAAGAQQPGFTGVIGQQAGVGNMWGRSPEQQRRDAEVQASSIHRPTAARGGAALKAMEDRALESVRGDAAFQREELQQAGATQRTGMQEQGGTARARLLETGRNDRFGQEQGLARDRFGQEQTAAGYQNRSAQRIEKAQQDLEAAGDDPVKLGAARQRLLGLQGKTDDARWKGIALQGATDAMGNKTEGVLAAVNERTGEVRRIDQRPAQSTAPADGTRVRGRDGLVYVVRNGQPVLER